MVNAASRQRGRKSVARRGVILLVEHVASHPAPALGGIAGATLFALASVGFTLVLGRITDDVIVPAMEDGAVETQLLVVSFAAIVVVALLRAVGVVSRRYLGLMAIWKVQRSWFRRLSDHYLRQPLRFFQTRSTGTLLAHADADLEAVTMAAQALPFTVGTGVLLVASAVSLAAIDSLLLLVALLLFPALVGMNRLYSRHVTDPSARAQAAIGDVSGVVHESLEGSLMIKLLGLQRHESERLAAAADRLREERLAIGRIRATFEPALDALPDIGTICLLGIGAWRMSTGAVSAGELVQAMVLFQILAFPIQAMGFLLQTLPQSVVARERLINVLNDDQRPHHAPVAASRGRRLPDGPLDVAVDGLSFAYRRQPVLQAIDLRVEPGETVALVGATGAGKSTLLHLMSGLVRPTAGEVRLAGVRMPNVDPIALRTAVALVHQDAFLFATTIRDNISAGCSVEAVTLASAIDTAQAQFVYDLPDGLDTAVGERGVSLSGGERQRVALARALCRRPQLLLLDDATSAVDPVVEEVILDGLAQRRITAVVVAHRVSTMRMAGRVMFLEGGRLAATGTHRHLLETQPGYRALASAYESVVLARPLPREDGSVPSASTVAPR